ncbi:MAG: chemotaxis protein CheC [Candidatus Nitrosotenuis sp.]
MEVLQPQNNLKRLGDIIGNYIGTKTASSLSMILNEPVSHRIRKVVEVASLDLDSVIPVFDIIPMCSVYLKGEGDVHVTILFFLPSSMARKFAAKLLGVAKMNKLSSLGRSSISEVGNMMAGSFFNALSDGTGFRVEMSTPGFAADTFKALIESPTAELASTTERFIITEAELHGSDSDIIIDALILLSPTEAAKILNAHK